MLQKDKSHDEACKLGQKWQMHAGEGKNTPWSLVPRRRSGLIGTGLRLLTFTGLILRDKELVVDETRALGPETAF